MEVSPGQDESSVYVWAPGTVRLEQRTSNQPLRPFRQKINTIADSEQEPQIVLVPEPSPDPNDPLVRHL